MIPGTQKPIVYEAELDNRKLLLLDTPGFDDSQRDNLEILREIVSHLYVFALKGNVVQVRGVIFLHDIIEVRMGGSQKKTWQILNAICGEEGMKNVLVGTTQWSKEGTNKFLAEERRETELIDKHWNGIYKSTRVIYNDRDNAVRIINDLLARPPVLLLVQTEMLKPPHTVEATTAGQVAMPEAYAEMQRLEKEMAEKQRKNEEEARRREEAHRKEQEEKRRQLEEERIRQEAEARRVAEVQRQEQIRLEEARRREAEEQRRKHEEELRRQAEAARILAQQEAQRRHEEEKRRIEEERRRWEEEQQRQREEMQRQEAERQRQWAEDNRRREEEAQRERERIQREIDHANHMVSSHPLFQEQTLWKGFPNHSELHVWSAPRLKLTDSVIQSNSAGKKKSDNGVNGTTVAAMTLVLFHSFRARSQSLTTDEAGILRWNFCTLSLRCFANFLPPYHGRTRLFSY